MKGLQERAAHAFPAVHLTHLDGWWLRHAGGGAWWTSSVLPHGPYRVRKTRIAEEFYAGHGSPARFQITPGACPTRLDAALAERGYRVECPMSLQSAPTAHVLDRLRADEPRIRVDDRPTEAWFATWLAVYGNGG